MTPEQVLEEMTDFASAKREIGTAIWPHEIRAVLAVVLPEHARMVREEVAQEILAAEREDAAMEPATQDSLTNSCLVARGLLRAARIARGEQP